jgi:hypothetical protein
MRRQTELAGQGPTEIPDVQEQPPVSACAMPQAISPVQSLRLAYQRVLAHDGGRQAMEQSQQ